MNKFLISWIPNLSGSIVLDAIVKHPKGDRGPSAVDFRKTEGSFFVKALRVTNDEPCTDFFQLAECEALYKNKDFTLLYNSLFVYSLKAKKKYFKELDASLSLFGVDEKKF